MLKKPTGMKEIFRGQYLLVISRQVPPASLLDISAAHCQRALLDESGKLINQMGTHNR
jgi:hypothetical protein